MFKRIPADRPNYHQQLSVKSFYAAFRHMTTRSLHLNLYLNFNLNLNHHLNHHLHHHPHPHPHLNLNLNLSPSFSRCNEITLCVFIQTFTSIIDTVETLYSTIYYSKYFIELNIDKSTQYVALWTHKRHPIPRPFGRAMECLLWVLQQKLIVL